MRPINDFDNVQEMSGDFEKLPAGGYIGRITSVEDVAEKEYLKIEYDIADGKYKGWWSDTYQRAHFWGGSFIRSYKESAAGFFKGFTSAVEKSNPGYQWAWDEQSLVGKLVGVVTGEEEYLSNKDKKVKTRHAVDRTISVADIREGKFKVPEFKPLTSAGTQPSFAEVKDDGELPF